METGCRTTYWRDYIPPPDTPRSKELARSNTYQWAEARCSEPFVSGWMQAWEGLLGEPYKGITVNGQSIPDLYHLDDDGAGGPGTPVPVAAMVRAAQIVLGEASADQRRLIVREIDAPEWRRWMNPEIYVYRHGVRLEEVSDALVEAIHGLMRASLSPAGYVKAAGCMKVNDFLGKVVDGTKVLNERSYNFTMFGEPSQVEPWGWQLHGHHLDMNCLVVRRQMVLSPVFMGAEPNVIDEGPNKGTELFTDQEQTALQLVQSMDQPTRARVRIYKQLSGPEFPSWRYHRADQRHLGGAFQDNRQIPYEGSKVSTFTAVEQDLVRQLIVLGINYLPEGALAVKVQEIAAHWQDTYFCWIGGYQRETGFYYKIHSPVVMVEFDHHSGVFLTNKDPLPFHIHTLVRTPNGNDYGKELLRQYRERYQRQGLPSSPEGKDS
ncbi:hypothetical protein A1O1_01426 [Capronia coronata CBS 617.96]|uniref:DUF3500 domain-containing protein n=1 Tax=Capronia coronata CBS 617.96 TaxID=1182541 RepID=W9Z2V4_9EURO|nr:uncharacterized protein A1O1_01426 [Capronia coronata CBS 617.96]EXJ96300.1 hypothetical protein A1O1_01426 [Capronia coronata CBS 617.96]